MKIFNYDSSTKQLTPLSTEGSSSVVTDTNGAVGTAGQSSNTQALMDYATGGVKTLVGSDSGKSARTIAAEEVAEQLVPENAGESLDTLQEIAAWIQSHPGDAASMNQRIANLETAVPFMLYIQNGTYGYKNSNDEFVAFKSQADIDAAVAAAAAVGTATAADVLAGKTFSNSSAKDIAGTMPDNSTRTSNGEVPGIQSNYPNEPVRNGISSQFNTGTDNVRRFAMAPPKGYYPGAASYIGIEAQTKTCTPSTSAQTISPDSSKVLESVIVEAMSPQRSLGTSATGSGIDNTGPYVYMPYGWWPEYSGKAGSSYTYMTAAQAVNACPKQEKTITASRSAQTVTPDSGKLLSKVTVNKYPDASGTFTTSTNSTAVDMGATNDYRYVNTTGVAKAAIAPNNNTIIFRFAQSASGYMDIELKNWTSLKYFNTLRVICPAAYTKVEVDAYTSSGSLKTLATITTKGSYTNVTKGTSDNWGYIRYYYSGFNAKISFDVQIVKSSWNQ